MPLEHRGFAIHISCDGQEIRQYGTEVVSKKQISCWIPSEAGNEFVVHYSDIRKDMDKVVRVYCDGRLMEGYGSRAGSSKTIQDVRISATEVKPLTFSHVLTSDDDAVSQNNVDISDLGVIEVRVFKARLKPKSGPTIRNVREIGVVSELSKKGGLHQVSLGKSKFRPSKNTCNWVFEGSETDPFASFLFRHRPADILQAMRIMPCPPASEEPAGPSKATAYKRRDSHDVSDKSRGKRRCITRVGSEAEEDVKPNIEDEEDDSHIKLLQENLKKMQDELNGLLTAKSGSIRVKAERAPSPIRVGSAAGEVIDLTED